MPTFVVRPVIVFCLYLIGLFGFVVVVVVVVV